MFDEREMLWNELVMYDIATEEEILLVVDICGYSMETLLNILYARTGFRNMEQFCDDYNAQGVIKHMFSLFGYFGAVIKTFAWDGHWQRIVSASLVGIKKM